MDIETKSTSKGENTNSTVPSSQCPDTPNLQSAQQQEQQNLYQPSLQMREEAKFIIQGTKQKLEAVGVLEIYDNQYVLHFHLTNSKEETAGARQSEPVTLNVEYRVTETVGTSGAGLIIFIDSDKNSPQGQQGDSKQAQQEQEEHSNIADEVLALIEKQSKGNLYLRGQCTVIIQLPSQPLTQQAYQLLSEYVGEEDEGNSQYEDDGELDEMISADNIDDHGNVILPSHQEDQQDDDQDQQDQLREQDQQEEAEGHMEDENHQH